jgi:hypothetical protein
MLRAESQQREVWPAEKVEETERFASRVVTGRIRGPVTGLNTVLHFAFVMCKWAIAIIKF